MLLEIDGAEKIGYAELGAENVSYAEMAYFLGEKCVIFTPKNVFRQIWLQTTKFFNFVLYIQIFPSNFDGTRQKSEQNKNILSEFVLFIQLI